MVGERRRRWRRRRRWWCCCRQACCVRTNAMVSCKGRLTAQDDRHDCLHVEGRTGPAVASWDQHALPVAEARAHVCKGGVMFCCPSPHARALPCAPPSASPNGLPSASPSASLPPHLVSLSAHSVLFQFLSPHPSLLSVFRSRSCLALGACLRAQHRVTSPSVSFAILCDKSIPSIWIVTRTDAFDSQVLGQGGREPHHPSERLSERHARCRPALCHHERGHWSRCHQRPHLAEWSRRRYPKQATPELPANK